LRDGGGDVVHVRELGMHTASDAEILVYAAREGRVVITLDRDFPQMLAFLGAARPSVVLVRQQQLRAAALIEVLTSIWREYEAQLECSCVLTVGSRGTRFRLLPIK
jgi:predicted nuclease of predicted toxin-antitoxin system